MQSELKVHSKPISQSGQFKQPLFEGNVGKCKSPLEPVVTFMYKMHQSKASHYLWGLWELEVCTATLSMWVFQSATIHFTT